MTKDKQIDNSFIDIKERNNDKVKKLFLKVEINSTDRDGRTLLINTSCYDNEELTVWAIENGAEINHQDQNGFSALHFAVQENNFEIVKLLLQNNIKVDLQDNNGNTSLWRGIYDNVDFEIVEHLIKQGANPKLKNFHEVAPIDLISDEDEDENSKKIYSIFISK